MEAPRVNGATAKPLRVAIAIAVGAHAVALAFASYAGVERAVARISLAPDTPVDIEIVEAPSRLPRNAEEANRSIEEGSNGRNEPIESTHARRRSGARESSPSPDSQTGEPDSKNGSDEFDALPEHGTKLPGLDGVPAWAVPGVLGVTPRAAPAPTTIPRRQVDRDAGGRAIRSTLDARDQKLGLALPAGNEAARAIEAVVMSAESPGESKATFAVTLDASGNVRDVSLARTTAGSEAVWARVMARVKASLAGRRLTMRGDAAVHGAKVMIEISTLDRFPDGSGSKSTSSTDVYGNHKTRTVLARIDVIVPGAKRLPEDVKPIVDQPFFTPPKPHESGIVPLTPGNDFMRPPGE